MASPFFLSIIFILSRLTLALLQMGRSTEGTQLVFEVGYSVDTVLDGDRSNIKVNPSSILRPSPVSDYYILLDSSASTFYTVSLPPSHSSNETAVIQKLSGNGVPGYVDGDLYSASFNKPKSFAVDLNGNVYVADQRNHAIRKITNSGVSTIAGGYSQKPGRTDGPGSDATFSDDFELSFIPEACALMISDHGNRLVRQINLKTSDCRRYPVSVLGSTTSWILSLGLSCLIGLILGLVIRPYLIHYEGHKAHLPNTTSIWNRCLMNVETQMAMLCSDIRSVVAESTVYELVRKIISLNLSVLSLMFRPVMDVRRKKQSTSSGGSSSVIVSPEVQEDDDPLRDLVTSYVQLKPSEEETKTSEFSSCGGGKIDAMILSNLVNFVEQSRPQDRSFTLVKRR